MKKIALLLAIGLNLSWPLNVLAEVTLPVGAGPYTVPTPKASDTYFHIGPLNMVVPWDHVNVVYLYDLRGKRNLVGGEAVFARLWILEGTGGAVTSLDGHGAPYVGGNIHFPNPVPQLAILNQIQPGIFGGYDFTRNSSIFGFKAAIAIF